MKFNPRAALGLPTGSVRAILALILTVGFVVGVFVLPTEQVAALGTMDIIVVKDYFDNKGHK